MGLVEYGSDSDDEFSPPPPPPPPPAPKRQHKSPEPQPQQQQPQPAKALQPSAVSPRPLAAAAADELEEPPVDAPIVGPSRPPAASPEPEDDEDEDEADQGPPLSPYSADRNLIHNLTLPPSIPTIPPSPPGSPPPPLSAKFSHFRDLKAKGVHFNEKLLRSSSLRNPNLLQKLTTFVGFEGMDQYATNLPTDVWDPTKFGNEAFAEELAKSQIQIAEVREKAKLEAGRDKVEFVLPTQIPPRGGVAESAAERVMKGLDRESKGPAPPPRGGRRDRDRDDGRGGRRDDRDKRRDDEGGRRKEDDRDRRRRDDDYRDRRRDDDPGKRRRSRSRSRDRDRMDRRPRDVVEYRDRR